MIHNNSCGANISVMFLIKQQQPLPNENPAEERRCYAGPGLLVPLVRGPLWEVLTAASVTGLSADWLIVSLSDTCATKDEMFVTARWEFASAPNRKRKNKNQSAPVSSHGTDDFHTSVRPWEPRLCRPRDVWENYSFFFFYSNLILFFFTLPCSFKFVSLI